MKKYILFLLVAICFTSCNCPYCHEWPCICDCEYSTKTTYGNDYFSAATLVGEWQMSGYHDQEYMRGCGIIPKDIVFAAQPVGEFGRCTMTYAIAKDPQWYQVDLYYNYVRRELTFYGVNEFGELEKLFSFTYKQFLFPCLVMQDSFGTYEWKKVRVTTEY